VNTLQPPQPSGDNLNVTLLAQGEQTGEQIAAQLAAFIQGAQRSLDLALYDFRLSDPLKAVVAGAMQAREAASGRTPLGNTQKKTLT